MSALMDATAQKKRKRDSADEVGGERNCEIERGAFWYEDGNIVLVAEGKGFKVYRGILSQLSVVFRDMFSLPQPADADLHEGCPVVCMSDSAQDLLYFLSALHDFESKYFNTSEDLTFDEVSAMLRLGSKFEVERIKAEAIRRFKLCFPMLLEDFMTADTVCMLREYADETRYYASTACGISLSLGDCRAVINLARSFNLEYLLPAAFYACAQIPTEQLVLPKYGRIIGGASWVLSSEDLVLCLNLKEWLNLTLRENIADCLETVGESWSDCDNSGPNPCMELKNRILFRLSRVNIGTSALLDDAILEDEPLPIDFCGACTSDCRDAYEESRQATWTKLRERFDPPRVQSVEGRDPEVG
ncbi:hypothetical protein EIP91_000485 [Steccherinum ochraceum]|uniref:BTB domain-containing protein n=1 Tax=Steccherinum ochraceum TaxID=92696 RepID=A0A4V2MXQ0_9APHY|nr:hypothetical protein EIP91_000485 [Steccherinum ochraceum]